MKSIGQRWRRLLPPGVVVVVNKERSVALRELRALPRTTRVALVGGRRLRRLARRAGVTVDVEYIALPSLSAPVAIVQVADEALRWAARSVLTAPSGLRRGHAPVWWAIRLVRRLPRLLVPAPVGDRIVIGVRR